MGGGGVKKGGEGLNEGVRVPPNVLNASGICSGKTKSLKKFRLQKGKKASMTQKEKAKKGKKKQTERNERQGVVRLDRGNSN